MDTFEEIWKSSPYNAWSAAYPAVVVLGAGAVAALYVIKNISLRRGMMLLTMLIFACLAVQASFLSIQEKWRIRGEWMRAHMDQLTEQQMRIGTADGANLIMKPPIDGLFALMIFVGVAAAISIFHSVRQTKS